MDELTVKVVSGTSENLHVRVDLASASVLSLKQQIEQQDVQRFPVSAQRLIFQGQILQDAKLLSDYNVTAGCALHLTVTPGVSAGPAPPTQLRAFLQQMRDHEPQEQYATAVRTLQKVCVNIVSHPTEEKYRKLRGHLVLVPTPEKWENLVACKAVVDSVATTLGSTTPATTAPSMGGFGGLGGDFASQAQAMMQNPAMLQSMANNPMVQQMAQQNPMLAQALQNPALLAQSMQALQQNPAMMQQINQMMSDPNAMTRMQQMMAGGGMDSFGGLGGFGGSPFGAAAPSSSAANPFAASSNAANPFATSAPIQAPAAPTPAPATTAASTDNSDEAYEEDEIAKAIARSLQDQ
ncbi:Ubiquitin family protein [Phytophthora palmivora]|uniref:Ubiquitin family protein n=1 Tax=Phytophthora palmivora TaxID=4796 RepID=A0A2P4Y7F6_9STRA|nr:Ubiquitin family protein [Phytophthora palmivora]